MTTSHPAPSSGAVNIRGAELTEDQLAALTDEQVERLTGGDLLPVDPRSTLLDDAADVDAARDELRDPANDPAFDPERALTAGGVDVDPDAGGDFDGDGVADGPPVEESV